MMALLATLRRELASLWLTPLAWILWLALLLIQGGVFATIVTSFATNPELTLDVGPLQAFFGQSVFVPLTFLFLCPSLTMRSFAEERRTGTIENLLSAPVGANVIVLGKYLASLISYVTLWLPTLLYPVVLRSVADVEWRVVATSYLGVFGLGAGFLAIGILCSTMTKSQFLSMVLSSGVLLAFVLLGVGENIFDSGWAQTLCSHLAIQSQLTELSQGIVSMRRLVFDGTLIALPLFLATRVVRLLEVVVKRRSSTLTFQAWLRWSSAVGIVAAVFLCVCVNVLGDRFDHRWDATSDRRYTLSNVTRETLEAITEPVKVVVLLSRADSMAPTVQQLLASYLSLGRQLMLQWVDPDRDPGKFLALQSELGISAGASQGGKSVSDSIIVLTRGKHRSYVTIDDIAQIDPNSGESEPRLEQAVTRALRQLSDSTRPLVCFTQGHRELNLQDEGPTGLSELRSRLVREPVELKTIDLGAGRQADLPRCRLVVVAAPDIPLSTWAQQQLQVFLRDGGSLFVMSNTIPDESGRARSTGLNPLVSSAGITIDDNVVVERDESQRLPDGFGESFFVKVSDHAATRSLNRGSAERSMRVLVSLAPALSLTDQSISRLLLTTTDNAIVVSDIGSYLQKETHTQDTFRGKTGKKLALAAAAELGSNIRGVARRLIVAPASIAENRAIRIPALVGNRAFIDGALSWLLARPVGIEIPSLHHAPVQLNLSDADLSRLNRYVLLIMPATIAALGLAVALTVKRRRRARLDQDNS